MERHLTVILSADVVGYSHLMEVDEERTHAAFCTCHAVIAELISRHRGRIFSGAGDSVLAEFASPVEAVRAAVDIQNNLAERSLPFAQVDTTNSVSWERIPFPNRGQSGPASKGRSVNEVRIGPDSPSYVALDPKR